ncbi:hypothetical protein L1D25_13455 [Vibrio parahaemolyticus]|nr:hypothetical protein [Vibrio parahaemolyticus]
MRLESPLQIYDRKQPFKVLGGERFSSAFSKASKEALGWSHGAHGLRFSYAQRRMDEELLELPYSGGERNRKPRTWAFSRRDH